MNTTGVITDKVYCDAMREHLARLEEEFTEIEALAAANRFTPLIYRATERNLQLLIEACIGTAKQAIKSKGQVVPSDARQAFDLLRQQGEDAGKLEWPKVIGMRNALVHDYLNIESARIMDVINGRLHHDLFAFVRHLIG
jgi:uncharacterized protein YutE (UPF0331/DUF86 family)